MVYITAHTWLGHGARGKIEVKDSLPKIKQVCEYEAEV